MRDPARLQSAIELVDTILAATREGGAAADTLAQRHFAGRRYAGAKDRAAVRALVFEAIRFAADPPASGRAALLGLAEAQRPDLLALFDGSAHAPALPRPDEPRAKAGLVPHWLIPAFLARFGARLEDEARALIGRAPLDLRWSASRAADLGLDAAAIRADLEAAGAVVHPIEGLPHGLRLETPIPLERHPLTEAGVLNVQDAGSQQVVALSGARPGLRVIDLCAGAGGKTLALADAMAGDGWLIATDTDRARLSAMTPRLARAGRIGAMVEVRLLDPGHEAERLADVAGEADLVLVDAPCSGSGTWRRNPELRWRLTPERLERLVALQSRLLALGARLLRPGGELVFATCSVLDAEGPDHLAADALADTGLRIVSTRRFTPFSDGCDGFFVARLGKA